MAVLFELSAAHAVTNQLDLSATTPMGAAPLNKSLTDQANTLPTNDQPSGDAESTDYFAQLGALSNGTTVQNLETGAAAVGAEEKPSTEKFNRFVWSFNKGLDTLLLKPVATVYSGVVPRPFKVAISQFFTNFQMPTTVLNDILQGKLAYAWSDTWTFVVNSTLGLAGFFNPAKHMQIPTHYEDFGLTLAYWSQTTASPYEVAFFFGPSTVRDSYGFLMDILVLNPWIYILKPATSVELFVANNIQKRAGLLPYEKILNESVDPYIFAKEAYLQTRDAQIEKNNHEHYPFRPIKRDLTAWMHIQQSFNS